ncbi:hypothetical protein P7C73_g2520, partial [Tremellales sp. Uapishka_1]
MPFQALNPSFGTNVAQPGVATLFSAPLAGQMCPFIREGTTERFLLVVERNYENMLSLIADHLRVKASSVSLRIQLETHGAVPFEITPMTWTQVVSLPYGGLLASPSQAIYVKVASKSSYSQLGFADPIERPVSRARSLIETSAQRSDPRGSRGDGGYYAPSETMELYIDYAGAPFIVPISTSASVGVLKRKIWEYNGIYERDQLLEYNGRYLADSLRSLRSYGILVDDGTLIAPGQLTRQHRINLYLKTA